MSTQIDRLTAALKDRYVIERELGSGGMAVVYLAEDLKHHRKVALKVLRPELAAVLGADRFVKEIETTAKLQHPNILPLFDSGEAAGSLYYVMPFVEGESLRDKLNRDGQLNVEAALKITTSVAAALQFAHDRGVIHRDIKPENILIQAGQALVADFGIALAVSHVAGTRLTETGLSLGTPYYMSPEQATSDEIDGRSDEYALGCVLYEMLMGAPPFVGPNPQAILRQQLVAVPPKIGDRTADPVPSHVSGALQKALAKQPGARFATIQDFSRALMLPNVSGQRIWKIAGVTAFATAVAVATFILRPGSDSQTAVIDELAIAIFPARVTGESVSYLEEGLPELLFHVFDGAGELRAVDLNVLIPAVNRLDVELDLLGVQSIGTGFGAGLQLMSRVTEFGDRLRITSSIYNASDSGEIARSTVDGHPDSIISLTEEIGRDLLSQIPVGAGIRLEDISGIETRNTEALRAYLEGERLARRHLSFQAAEAFERAANADSNLALAWLQRVQELTFCCFANLAVPAVEDAVRHRAGLSGRDSLLLDALNAWLDMDFAEHDRLTAELVQVAPGYVESWVFRGWTSIWTSWRVGKSLADARSELRRALALDPHHPDALFFLAWLERIDGNFDVADSVQRVYMSGSSGFNDFYTDWAAFTFGDSVERETSLNAIRDRGGLRIYFLLDHTKPAVQPLIADLLIREADARTRLTGHLLFAQIEAGRGRWMAAKEQLREAANYNHFVASVFQALLASTPWLRLESAEFERARDQLRLATERATDVRPRNPFLIPEDQMSVVRDYVMGMSFAAEGNSDSLRHYVESLRRIGPQAPCLHLTDDWALEIEAQYAVSRNDFETALAKVEETRLDGCSPDNWHSKTFGTRSRGRYLRAVALVELELYQQAAGWLRGFGVVPNREATLYMGPRDYLLGEAYRGQGNRGGAVEYYGRFLKRWTVADSVFSDLTDNARERLAELTSR